MVDVIPEILTLCTTPSQWFLLFRGKIRSEAMVERLGSICERCDTPRYVGRCWPDREKGHHLCIKQARLIYTDDQAQNTSFTVRE